MGGTRVRIAANAACSKGASDGTAPPTRTPSASERAVPAAFPTHAGVADADREKVQNREQGTGNAKRVNGHADRERLPASSPSTLRSSSISGQ